VNLDALTYAGNLDTIAPILEDPNHVFVRGSIGDRPLVDRLLVGYKPQAVVNFAAQTHVDRSIDAPKPFIQTNVVATQELLEAVLGYWGGLAGARSQEFRFLHVSTDEVYGALGPMGYFTEESPYAPSSPYAASRRPLTTWSEPIIALTVCQSSLPTARTTTAHTSSREADTAHDLQRPQR
jgi:dTDP-glucose 4,6-dehydratase